jgi:primosomal replication protein N
MKVTLTWTVPGTLGSSFVLADSPSPVPMVNFRINGSRNVQEAQFFRASAREFYDRGNRKTEVTFETSRVFGSQLDAESFILMHETQFPGQGLVTFLAGASGRATASRYLQNAVVEAVASSLSGCTTRHSYRISGGIMQTTPN